MWKDTFSMLATFLLSDQIGPKERGKGEGSINKFLN